MIVAPHSFPFTSFLQDTIERIYEKFEDIDEGAEGPPNPPRSRDMLLRCSNWGWQAWGRERVHCDVCGAVVVISL